MEATKLMALDTGKTITTIYTTCLMDLKKGLDDKGYHVLVLTPTDLDKLRDASCEPLVLEHLSGALGGKSEMLFGYAAFKPEARWRVTGEVTDRDGTPLPGLRVLAYDKDVLKDDDFLGVAFTDETGFFEIGYEESDFKSPKLVDFEGNPDIYIELTDVAGGASKRTVVKGEAEQLEHFDIKVSFDSPTTTLRALAGRYYIEEDMLETEINELTARTRKDPGDADGYFLLGLCLIERVKIDLRRSEWVLGEVRSDDDILAIAAIECFDRVIELDPEREEEARHYRDYAQELQNLTL